MITKTGGSTAFKGVFTYLRDVRQFYEVTIQQATLDLIEKRLQLYGVGDEFKVYEAIRNHDIDDLAIDNQSLIDYELIIKDRKSKVKFDVLYNLMVNFGKQLQQNFNELGSLQSKVEILLDQSKLPHVLTLREIHEQLFPEKNLNYLRNILSKNKTRDNNVWKSYLVLGRFSLRFEKPLGTKIWYVYRREFVEVRKND